VPELTLRDRPIHTVFDLLGRKENDITFSLGWALANSDELTARLLAEAFDAKPGEVKAMRLQEFERDSGITDIEVQAENAHLIVEAKRGWDLPTRAQLELYAGREPLADQRAILVVAEASADYALPRLGPMKAKGVPVHYRSWEQVTRLAQATADRKGAGLNEKRLLRELVRYLKGLMTMQDVTSNMVYVVTLGTFKLFGTDISNADIVVKHDRYFCPVGGGRGGWPRTPPNYLGFRFHGCLQQIRHVEGYTVEDEPWADLFPNADWETGDHYHYKLGPVIVPAGEVRTGNLYRAQRVWAAFDLLLTCDTVAEARDETNARLAAAGENT